MKLTSSPIAVMAVLGMGMTANVHAQQVWDPNTNPGVQGGSGIWDDTNQNWTQDGGATNTTFDGTGAPPPEIIFDIQGGVVDVVGDKNIGDLTVEVGEYILNGDRLIVGDEGTVLTVDSFDDVLELNVEIAGTGDITKTGNGSAVLNAENTNIGLLTIEEGGVTNNGTIVGNVDNQAGGVFNNTGIINGDLDNAGIINASGNILGNVTNNGGGAAGQFIITDDLTIEGAFTNNSTSADAVIINTGQQLTSGNFITNSGNVSNDGAIVADVVINGGQLNNDGGSVVTGNVSVNGGLFENSSGAIVNGNIDNLTGDTGIFISSGTINGNLSTINTPVLSGQINGDFLNAGDNSVVISGDLGVAGTIINNSTDSEGISLNNGVTLTANELVINSGGIVSNGNINSNIDNNGGVVVVESTGQITGNIDNADRATLQLEDGTLIGNINNDGNLDLSGIIIGNLESSNLLEIDDQLIVDGLIDSDINVEGTGNLTALEGVTGDVNVEGDLTGGGTLNLTGPFNGNLTNAGFSSISGDVNGDVVNNGGGAAGQLNVDGNAIISGALINNSNSLFAITVGAGDSLQAGSFDINNGVINNDGFIDAPINVSAGALNNSTDAEIEGDITISGGALNNAGQVDNVDNQTGGQFTNALTGVAGNVSNDGQASNLGTLNSLQNTGGDFNNSGSITGNVENIDGDLTNTGDIGGALDISGGSFDQNVGGSVAGLTTISDTGSVTNSGSLGAVNNQASFTNEVDGVTGAVENSGIATNAGEIASLNNTTGIFSNSGNVVGNVVNLSGNIDNSGTISGDLEITGGVIENQGTIEGAVDISEGLFDQEVGGEVLDTVTISGNATVENSGALAGVVNQVGSTFVNEADGNIDSLINFGSAVNEGELSSSITNNGGNFSNEGTITGIAVNNGGEFNNGGTVSGDVDVQSGTFTQDVTGFITGVTDVADEGLFDNSGTANVVNVEQGGEFRNNAGAAAGDVENGGTSLNQGSIANLDNTQGTFNNSGVITDNVTNTGGVLENNGIINGEVDVLGGAFEQTSGGRVDGASTISGVGSLTNAGTLNGVTIQSDGTFTNQAGAIADNVDNAGTVINEGTVTSLINNGGSFINDGVIEGNVDNNAGVFSSTGAIGGNLVNAGTINIEGFINGDITNNAEGNLNLTGLTTATGVFTNIGMLDTSGFQITGLTEFNNAGVINVNGIADISADEFNSLVGNNVNLGDGVADDVLNINGNFNQAGTITFDIDSAAGTSDLINVTGVATVAGPVDINLLQGGALSQTTFLTADGGIIDNGVSVGNVTGLANPLAETSILLANANELALLITINADQGNFNVNQTSLQDHINDGGSLPVLNQILTLAGAKQTEDALDQLGAEIYANQEFATLDSADRFTEQLTSCESGGLLHAGNCYWVQPTGGSLERDGTAENIEYDVEYVGLSAGFQMALNETLFLGFGLGFESRDIDNQANQSSSAEQFNLGASVLKRAGSWEFSGALAGGITNIDTVRNISVGNINGRNTSDHDITWIGSQLRASYLSELDNEAYIKPMLEVTTSYVSSDGFTEGGNETTALLVQDNDDFHAIVTPGIETGKDFILQDDINLRAFLKVGLEINSDDESVVSARFANAPSSTGGFTSVEEFDSAIPELEAGLTLLETDKTNIQLGYQGRFSNKITQHGGYLSGKFKF